jgi:hypothetical protein
MIPALLTVALPIATAWVEEQQAFILKEGVPLTDHQCFDAHLVGVKEPKRVRLMKVDYIPLPTHPVLAKANELVGLVSPVTAGITFGYGIYIRDDMWGDRPLVVHELVHTGQYERFGQRGRVPEGLPHRMPDHRISQWPAGARGHRPQQGSLRGLTRRPIGTYRWI